MQKDDRQSSKMPHIYISDQVNQLGGPAENGTCKLMLAPLGFG